MEEGRHQGQKPATGHWQLATHSQARRRARRARRSGRRRRAARRACRARRSAPSSSTTIWSASRTVERRWAIAIVVRPSTSRSSASCTARSVCVSSARRRLVEHEHRRVAQDRRGRSRCAASRRPRSGSRARRRPCRSPPGSERDQLVDLRRARGRLDLLVGRVGPREAQVLAHGRVEEVGLLRDDADASPRATSNVSVADVDAVDRHRAPRRRRRAARRGSRASSCPQPVSPTIAVVVPGGHVEVDAGERPGRLVGS